MRVSDDGRAQRAGEEDRWLGCVSHLHCSDRIAGAE